MFFFTQSETDLNVKIKPDQEKLNNVLLIKKNLLYKPYLRLCGRKVLTFLRVSGNFPVK